MADKTEFLQVIDDAILDADSLERFINGSDSETVLTRLSAEYPTLQKAIKQMFENGGLPATPFATKALMEASALVDGDYAMVTDDTANNGLYVKTAGAWVKSDYDPVATSKVYTDALVTTTQRDARAEILSAGANIFNNNLIPNKSIGYDGVVNTSENYSITPYIPVNPNSKYHYSSDSSGVAVIDVAYYDAAKKFMLRKPASEFVDSSGVFSVPAGCFFVRFNTRNTLINTAKVMLSEGSEPIPYTPYVNPVLKNVSLSEGLINGIYEGIDFDFLKYSNNLYNPYDVDMGMVVGVDGEYRESTLGDYWTTGFISIDGASDYTISGEPNQAIFHYSSYYDENKVFITRVGHLVMNDEGFEVIRTPSNARYLRLSMRYGGVTGYKRMLNKGDTALPYEVGGRRTLNNVRLSASNIDQISNELKISEVVKSDSPVIDMPMDGVFSTSKVWDSYSAFDSISSAEVYAMYEDLRIQHPDYISKQFLGNDTSGNPITSYKFTPARPETSTPIKRPKIFLTLGTHGHEHVSSLACYLMFSEICNNWKSDKLLEALRFNVDFIIIPVVNPSGWNAFRNDNDNGVNINRNFTTNWVAGADKGTEPLSELESQYIKQVFDENDDIDIMYDFHNFSGQTEDNSYIWISAGTSGIIEDMGSAFIRRMTRKWREEYSWFPEEPWFCGYTSVATGPMVKEYARERGVKFSATFEVCRTVFAAQPDAVNYDALHCKMHMESITNWLLISINELTK